MFWWLICADIILFTCIFPPSYGLENITHNWENITPAPEVVPKIPNMK